MSSPFSGKTKELLSRVPVKARHCRLAELHALAAGIGGVAVEDDGSLVLVLQSENLAAVRRGDYLLQVLLGYAPVCSAFCPKGNTPLYTVSVRAAAPLQKLLVSLGFMNARGVLREMSVPAPAALLKNECCRRAFLRGAFLAGGYVSDPQGAYHLEILCAGPARAAELKNILDSLGVKGRVTTRKGRDLLYIKDSESISDTLSLMGAYQSRLEWENARVYRSLQGQVNRQVNCETANLAKSSRAGSEQAAAIAKIRDKAGLSSLPEHLKEIAALRLEYPDYSLEELGGMLHPPAGKSAVNHRLRRLRQIAQELEE